MSDRSATLSINNTAPHPARHECPVTRIERSPSDMSNHRLAHEIHHLPHHVLAIALPDLRPMHSSYEIRAEFVRWTLRQPNTFPSWMHAWNVWTHASPRAAGAITLSVLCPDCHGRLFSTRRGIPAACTTCCGRRRTTIRSRALWQDESPPTATSTPQ